MSVFQAIQSRPFVSIIIPVKNEAENIEQCLTQLLIQAYDRNQLEILVIDAHSQDKTREVILNFSHINQMNVKILDDPGQQRSAGLNEGIRQAKGEVILRIDARTIIPKDYIEQCVRTLLTVDADNVGGVQFPLQEKYLNNTQQAIGYAMSHPFGVGNSQFRLGKKSGYVDSVYLGCFRKDLFEKIGLFDEESPVISEDSDVNYRIRQQGGKVFLNKDIIAHYVPRDNLKDFSKLYFRYGAARAGFLLKWRTLTGWRQLAPPLFLLTLVFLPILAIFSHWFFCLWGLLVLVYFGLNIKYSSSIAKKNAKKKLLTKLLCVFPTMHFSWAAGFLTRLFLKKRVWGG